MQPPSSPEGDAGGFDAFEAFLEDAANAALQAKATPKPTKRKAAPRFTDWNETPTWTALALVAQYHRITCSHCGSEDDGLDGLYLRESARNCLRHRRLSAEEVGGLEDLPTLPRERAFRYAQTPLCALCITAWGYTEDYSMELSASAPADPAPLEPVISLEDQDALF